MVDENNLVEKSKPLVWAKFNNYTINELKLLEVYLSRINARNPESCEVSFTKQEYCELMGLTSETTAQQLKKYVQHFLGNVVTIDTEKGWKQFTLFTEASCEVDEEIGQNVVTISCNPKLQSIFFNIAKDGYIRYKLKNIINLRSQYSVRLYSLLKDKSFGKHEWQVGLKELRELLGATSKNYESFKEFNRVVLKRAHEEINQYTDIQYSYEKITKGRLTRAIKFKISKQKVIDQAPTKPDQLEGQMDIYDFPEYCPPEPEQLTREQIYAKKINDEAFRGEFTLEQAEYLVDLGSKMAMARVDADMLFDQNACDVAKISYYHEKYLQMCAGASSKSSKSRANYLATLLKADFADSIGFVPDKNEKGKYVPKKSNKFNNFEGRNYDFDELEKLLVNSQ